MAKWKNPHTHAVCVRFLWQSCCCWCFAMCIQRFLNTKHNKSLLSFVWIAFDVVFVSVLSKILTAAKLTDHHLRFQRFFLLSISFARRALSPSVKFLFDFRSFYTRCEFYLMQTYTLTVVVARHHSAIVHGFGIWFQCFINTECTSYVRQPIRWYKTISHFSTFPTMWLVFVFTPKPICAYTKYLWLYHSYLSDFELGCWLFYFAHFRAFK